MASSGSSQHQIDRVRILHWNIHSWLDDGEQSNVESVIEVIRETGPDVVSLVEVDESWGALDRLSEVAARHGYLPIFVPTFEFGRDVPEGGFGNALLTRLPVLAVQQWQLVWPIPQYDGSEPSEPRSVLLAKLDIGGGSVWVGSTHLPRSDEQVRTDAFQRLAALVAKLDGPWFVCGDFNTPPPPWLTGDRPLAVSPNPVQPTHPAHEPVEPIDYCIAAGDVRTEASVFARGGSDHLPVLVSAWLTR